MIRTEKRRADQLLLERGLAESRAKAQALILAGVVNCAGRRIEKPGEQLAADAALAVKGNDHPWVSRGAVRVYAIDVGHGQLAWKLRQDPRVVVHERVNARHLTRAQVPEPIHVITCDASFIGLATLLPAPLALAAEEAEFVALVKPQFEAGREHVGKGGVVRDPAIHHEVCKRVAAWVGAQPGWTVMG